MNTHFMKLNPEPFNKIKSGAKTYELHLHDEKRKSINVGDFIEFTKQNSAEKCIVKVIDLLLFNNFAELYAKLPLDQCGYDTSKLENASPKDMEKYYTKKEQRRYGVIAIKTEPVE